MSEFEYGEIMLGQGDISSMSEWSKEKEIVCIIMDRQFDYLWDFDDNKWNFYDRSFSSDIEDEMLQARIDRNEHELHFDSYEEVLEWIYDKLRIKVGINDITDDIGTCDEVIDIIKFNNQMEIDIVNAYMEINCIDNDNPHIYPDQIGKIYIFEWGVCRDWCICHKDIDTYLSDIRKRYEYILEKKGW